MFRGPPHARCAQRLVAEDRSASSSRASADTTGSLRLDLQPDGPDWREAAEILTDAYRQVAPKFLVARLD
jgi:hypothetical protein